MGSKILAYDLGTGGSKASLYDGAGTSLASTFVPYETLYPQAGWHEQRPEDWWNAIVESTRRLLAEKQAQPGDIDCLAISGHSLGVVPIDRNGNLLLRKRRSGPTRARPGKPTLSSQTSTETLGT